MGAVTNDRMGSHAATEFHAARESRTAQAPKPTQPGNFSNATFTLPDVESDIGLVAIAWKASTDKTSPQHDSAQKLLARAVGTKCGFAEMAIVDAEQKGKKCKTAEFELSVALGRRPQDPDEIRTARSQLKTAADDYKFVAMSAVRGWTELNQKYPGNDVVKSRLQEAQAHLRGAALFIGGANDPKKPDATKPDAKTLEARAEVANATEVSVKAANATKESGQAMWQLLPARGTTGFEHARQALLAKATTALIAAQKDVANLTKLQDKYPNDPSVKEFVKKSLPEAQDRLHDNKFYVELAKHPEKHLDQPIPTNIPTKKA
jgi:hypothetical protein